MIGDWIAVSVCALGTILDLWFPWMRSGQRWHLFWAVWFAGLAVLHLIWDGLPVAIAWAALSGANAWLAHQQRPPRKRKPSKVAARIKDLGHRLVLVPAGSR